MIRSPEHMPYGEVQGELNWFNFAKRQLRSNLMQVLATKSFFFLVVGGIISVSCCIFLLGSL